jgi:hypothetical protein
MWTWAWSGAGFGIAAGEYALIPIVQQPWKRQEQAVLGTVSFYLPASIAVLPLAVRADDEELETGVAKAWTRDGVLSPCLVLERAEELLEHAAANEAAHTSLVEHIVTITLTAGYAAVLWALFHDPGGLVLNGVGALAIGEAEILTVPTGAVSGLARYREGDLRPANAPHVAWTLAPLGVGPGLSLLATF